MREYPRRVDHARALDEFILAIEDGCDPEEMIARAASYARNVDPRNIQYVPSPKVWIRDRRWNDEDLFTSERTATREWFTRVYREADAAAVEREYGYVYPDPPIPTDCVDVEAFHRDSRKLFIAGVANHVLNQKPLPE